MAPGKVFRGTRFLPDLKDGASTRPKSGDGTTADLLAREAGYDGLADKLLSLRERMELDGSIVSAKRKREVRI